MISLLMMITVSLIISGVILILALFLGKKMLKEREKLTPFECGFDPKSLARMPFSLRFFVITVIFLVFDIEIVLLLPLSLIQWSGDFLSFSVVASFITIILMLGLFHEWNQGMLKWIT